jgi:hypothetical protein
MKSYRNENRADEISDRRDGGGRQSSFSPQDQKVAAKAWKMIIEGDFEGAVDFIISSYPKVFVKMEHIKWKKYAVSRKSTWSTDGPSDQVWEGQDLILATDFGRAVFHLFLQGNVGFGDLVRNIYHEYEHTINAFNAHSKMEYNEDEFRAHYAAMTNPDLPHYSIGFMRFYINQAETYYQQIPIKNRTKELKEMYDVLEKNLRPKYYPPESSPAAKPKQ